MSEHFSSTELSSYFDGNMPTLEAGSLEQHLTSCATCRAVIASMSGARRAVRLLPMPDVPESTWQRIERRLEPTPPPRRRAASRPPRRRGQASTASTRQKVASSDKPGRRRNALKIVLVALSTLLVASPLLSRLTAAVEPEGPGIDYGAYLEGLTDREVMERFEARYGRQRLPVRRGSVTNVLVGSDLLDRPPQGLIPRTAYSLSDDGVRAIQITYVREGILLNIFRQPAEHPIRLEGFNATERALSGITAAVVESRTHRAATFTHGAARYVIVVPRGKAPLAELVASFAALS